MEGTKASGMRRPLLLVTLMALAIAVGGAILIFWVGPSTGGAVRGDALRLRPGDPQLVAEGAGIYADHCATCHGADLEGQADWRQRRPDGRLPAPPHDDSGHTWHHPDEVLFALVKQGPAALVGGGYQSDMPAYEGVLTDQEILAVLSYIKSRWPEAIRRRHDAANEARSGQPPE